MFGINGGELILIGLFALVVFGPDKLPQFARTIGQMMAEFKKAQASMEAMIKAEMSGLDGGEALENAGKPAADPGVLIPPPPVVPSKTPVAEWGADEDEEEDEE